MNKTSLLLFLLLVFNFETIAQDSKYIITDIGLLGMDGDYIAGCSGIHSLSLKIESVEFTAKRIKVIGLLIDELSETPLINYRVFTAMNDTFSFSLNDISIVEDQSKKVTFSPSELDGKIEFRTKLPPSRNLYIEVIGYGVLELKRKKE